MTDEYYYAENQAAYERLAREGKSEWNDLFNDDDLPQPQPWTSDHGNQAFLESALARLDIPAGARALEYGCGTGRTACFIAAAGFRVHAVDLIPTAITMARRFAADRGLTIDFEVRDICKTTFQASYGMVVDGFCLQSIVTDGDRSRLFAAVRSALEPGGHYLISTAMYEPDRVYEDDSSYDPATGIVLDNGMPHRRHLRPEALRAELEQHGFRIVSQEGEFGGNVVCTL